MNDNITPWQFIWDSRPFTIGMRPLHQAEWLVIDRNLADYLGKKAEILAISPDMVFAEQISSRAAQSEIAGAIRAHLSLTCPEIYQFSGARADIAGFGAIDTSRNPPLLGAARLVQEDLLVLERQDTGWHLTAGALFFPSSWRLADKIGLRLDDIHLPVPGFGPGNQAAPMMERIFDHLPSGKLALRWNWGLHGDGALAQHPESGDALRFAEPHNPACVHLRHERQTLTRFPGTGAILFTVRLHVLSCAELCESAPGRAHAMSLAKQLASLDADQLAYKGLAKDRDALLAMLDRVVKGRDAKTP